MDVQIVNSTGNLRTATATIANGGSLSAAVDLTKGRLVGIQMPAGWDAAAITFQGSYDGATFANLYDKGGTEYSVTTAASRFVLLPAADFAGLRYIKARSGTAGVPVNQTAERALTLVLAPQG